MLLMFILVDYRNFYSFRLSILVINIEILFKNNEMIQFQNQRSQFQNEKSKGLQTIFSVGYYSSNNCSTKYLLMSSNMIGFISKSSLVKYEQHQISLQPKLPFLLLVVPLHGPSSKGLFCNKCVMSTRPMDFTINLMD